MWSGFMYKTHFVCVPLIFSFGRYLRTSESIQGLRLLEWRPAIGFKIRDIYLSLLGQRGEERERGNARQPTILPGTIRVVLSSSSDTSITIDDERDKRHLYLYLQTSKVENFGGTASRTEVWAADVYEPPDQERDFTIRLLLSDPRPVWTRDRRLREIVHASLHFKGLLGYATCTLNTGDSSSLGPAQASDRAEAVLKNGQTLTASIRRIPTTHPELNGVMASSGVTLRVAVTPGSLSPPQPVDG